MLQTRVLTPRVAERFLYLEKRTRSIDSTRDHFHSGDMIQTLEKDLYDVYSSRCWVNFCVFYAYAWIGLPWLDMSCCSNNRSIPRTCAWTRYDASRAPYAWPCSHTMYTSTAHLDPSSYFHSQSLPRLNTIPIKTTPCHMSYPFICVFVWYAYVWLYWTEIGGHSRGTNNLQTRVLIPRVDVHFLSCLKYSYKTDNTRHRSHVGGVIQFLEYKHH